VGAGVVGTEPVCREKVDREKANTTWLQVSLKELVSQETRSLP
jgi:hypothetical protein